MDESHEDAAAAKKRRRRERQQRRLPIIDTVPRLPPVDSVPMCVYRENAIARLCHTDQITCFPPVGPGNLKSQQKYRKDGETVGNVDLSQPSVSPSWETSAEEPHQDSALWRLRRKLLLKNGFLSTRKQYAYLKLRLKNGFLGTRKQYAYLRYLLDRNANADDERPLLNRTSRYDSYRSRHEEYEDDSDSDDVVSVTPRVLHPQHRHVVITSSLTGPDLPSKYAFDKMPHQEMSWRMMRAR
ncbi:hypothetical protein LSAT2_026139 [Lamellibrachia satsuma]|nr:hypothetical protein LSAT2_026139 [Lamellibrachia satsuma]